MSLRFREARARRHHLAVPRGAVDIHKIAGPDDVPCDRGFLRRFLSIRPAHQCARNRRRKPTFRVKKPAAGKTDKLRALTLDQELQALMKPYVAAVGETDKLRALTEDSELQLLMEQYKAPPSDREAALKAFIKKADTLHPDWRETWEASTRDGRVLRALAIHCVLRIRARSDLDELERFEAKTAETDFVSSFHEVTESPSASAAFRMTLAFHELMRIAKLDPDEMAEIARQLRKDIAAHAGSQPKTEKDWVQPVLNAARKTTSSSTIRS